MWESGHLMASGSWLGEPGEVTCGVCSVDAEAGLVLGWDLGCREAGMELSLGGARRVRGSEEPLALRGRKSGRCCIRT